MALEFDIFEDLNVTDNQKTNILFFGTLDLVNIPKSCSIKSYK